MCGLSKAPARSERTTVRPFRPVDVLRGAVYWELGEGNHAHLMGSLERSEPTGPSIGQMASTARSIWGHGSAWVQSRGNRVIGFVAASKMSGPKSWQVASLFLRQDQETELPDLLESLTSSIAAMGGERVFLRLRRDDPVVDDAQRSGFFHCVDEVLYARSPRAGIPSLGSPPQRGAPHIRAKSPGDDFYLFRIHNAATPAEVRRVVGMTFSQWTESLEPAHRRSDDFVFDQDGTLTGSTRITVRSGICTFSVIANPDNPDCIEHLLDFIMDRELKTEALYCLVPQYQGGLRLALVDRGFKAVSEYVTVVKSLAIRGQTGLALWRRGGSLSEGRLEYRGEWLEAREFAVQRGASLGTSRISGPTAGGRPGTWNR